MSNYLSEDLRSILATSMDGFLLIGLDGTILEANDSYCQLVGYSHDQLINRHLSSVNAIDSKELIANQLESIIRLGTLQFKTKHISKNNSVIDVEVRAQYSPLNGGTVFSFIKDISPDQQSFEIISTRLRLMEYSLNHSLDELLQKALDEAETLTGSCIGFYHLLDEDRRLLTLHAWSTQTASKFCKAEGSGSHYPVSIAGVWADCVRERCAIIHNDYISLPHRKGLPSGHASLVRELVVPVFRRDKIVAVLGIGNKLTDYNQRDVDTVSLLADLVWDVVERKQAEERLRMERDRAQSYLDTVETMIVALDSEGRIITINRKACQILGSSEDDLLGSFWCEHCVPEPEGMVPSDTFISRLLSGDDLSKYEYQENNIITRCGELRHIAWHNALLYDDQGAICGALLAGEDITERTQTEIELFKLYQAVEQCPAPIMITDLNGNIEFVNPAFCTLTGYTANEVLGKNPRILKSEATAAEVYQPLWEKVYQSLWETITAGNIWNGEFHNKKKNGECYWEKACIGPIIDTEGVIKHFVAIKEDISKQKEHEAERNTLEAQLRQAQKMELVGRLAGGVAHDFNNLLMIIKNFTFLGLMETDPSEQNYTFLSEISKATERAIDLTRQLLAYARKQAIAPKVIDLNDAVEGMLQILQRLSGENVQLTWQPAQQLWPVKLDPSQFDQILANLCTNAKDAIDGTGKITIKTENKRFGDGSSADHDYIKDGDYVLITVSDNGCGMDKETIAHIFEPFFTTKDVGKGTGLGLATVYGIVKQNGGFIVVDSVPASGTTFKIYLSRYEDSKPIAQ